MMVFCYYIAGTCRYCAIYKFVVIRIFLNQIKVKIYCDKLCIWTTDYRIYDVLGSILIGQLAENLLIFLQY